MSTTEGILLSRNSWRSLPKLDSNTLNNRSNLCSISMMPINLASLTTRNSPWLSLEKKLPPRELATVCLRWVPPMLQSLCQLSEPNSSSEVLAHSLELPLFSRTQTKMVQDLLTSLNSTKLFKIASCRSQWTMSAVCSSLLIEIAQEPLSTMSSWTLSVDLCPRTDSSWSVKHSQNLIKMEVVS